MYWRTQKGRRTSLFDVWPPFVGLIRHHKLRWERSIDSCVARGHDRNRYRYRLHTHDVHIRHILWFISNVFKNSNTWPLYHDTMPLKICLVFAENTLFQMFAYHRCLSHSMNSSRWTEETVMVSFHDSKCVCSCKMSDSQLFIV